MKSVRHCLGPAERAVKDTGGRSAPPAVALIEEHEAVGTGIKKPAVPGRTSRTRAAVQDDGCLPMWIATGLPVDEKVLEGQETLSQSRQMRRTEQTIAETVHNMLVNATANPCHEDISRFHTDIWLICRKFLEVLRFK